MWEQIKESMVNGGTAGVKTGTIVNILVPWWRNVYENGNKSPGFTYMVARLIAKWEHLYAF